jgi:hypothetical protein
MHRFPIVVAVALSLGGCATATTMTTMTATQGPDQSDAQLAVVDQQGCAQPIMLSDRILSCIVSIAKDDHLYYDDTRDNAIIVKLQPGEYLITYNDPYYKGRAFSSLPERVDLRPGHRYLIKEAPCQVLMFLPCWPLRTTTLWIEDSTTGEVIARTKQ